MVDKRDMLVEARMVDKLVELETGLSGLRKKFTEHENYYWKHNKSLDASRRLQKIEYALGVLAVLVLVMLLKLVKW
jgi:hypothetical protein